MLSIINREYITVINFNKHHEYLNPLCSATTIDNVWVRKGILSAIKKQSERIQGIVLDIGSGESPYKPLLLAPPNRVHTYIALDLKDAGYHPPNVEWDGLAMPFRENSIDCALATEVFEHCPEPEQVMRETLRVLRPRGSLFFTVPFLWPIHCAPHDEYRYTPFALERLLRKVGFVQIELQPLGAWDTSLAQMIGLWIRRRPMSERKRVVLSKLAVPIVRYLVARDRLTNAFYENAMITGISGTAVKPEC